MQAKDTDRVKMDDRDYRVTCAHCGDTFEATRSDASFCSAKCRVAYSREPAKLEGAIINLGAVGRAAMATAVRYKRNVRVYEAMKLLHQTIGRALDLFEQE